MDIFVQLKFLLSFAGIYHGGPSQSFRRLVAICVLFYGVVTITLYLSFEAVTFQERAQCMLFLCSLSNGLSLYLFSLWQQDIFAKLNDLEKTINQRNEKVSNGLYRVANSNIEKAFKAMVILLFGVLLPLTTAPELIFSYYKYILAGNSVSSFKLTFLVVWVDHKCLELSSSDSIQFSCVCNTIWFSSTSFTGRRMIGVHQ